MTSGVHTLAVSPVRSVPPPVLRIYMITATFPPDVCGIGDYTYQLCQALQGRGVELQIVTSRQNIPVEPSENEVSLIARRIVSRWTLRSVLGLVHEIRVGNYDCVHIQYSPGFYGILSCGVNLLPLLLVGSSCRTVVTFHEIYAPKLKGFKNRLLSLHDHIKDTVLLTGSSAAILTVPNRLDRLGKWFPWLRSRLRAIPVGTGVRVKSLTEEERDTARARFGLHPDNFLIGSFGSMHVDRHYDTLLRVLNPMTKRYPQLRIVLIGAYQTDHTYYQFLKKWIVDLNLEPYIIWTGYGTEEEISRWLAMLDLYVMTDVRGASGRKSSLITAIAHGLPVISTRGKDTPPEIVDGENAVFVDVDDEAALSYQIERLLHDPGTRDRLRRGAQRVFASYYAWDSIAQKTIEAYESGAKR